MNKKNQNLKNSTLNRNIEGDYVSQNTKKKEVKVPLKVRV